MSSDGFSNKKNVSVDVGGDLNRSVSPCPPHSMSERTVTDHSSPTPSPEAAPGTDGNCDDDGEDPAALLAVWAPVVNGKDPAALPAVSEPSQTGPEG